MSRFTNAPDGIRIGMFLGLVVGLATQSLVLGIIVAVLASFAGWYLIAEVEAFSDRDAR